MVAFSKFSMHLISTYLYRPDYHYIAIFWIRGLDGRFYIFPLGIRLVKVADYFLFQPLFIDHAIFI